MNQQQPTKLILQLQLAQRRRKKKQKQQQQRKLRRQARKLMPNKTQQLLKTPKTPQPTKFGFSDCSTRLPSGEPFYLSPQRRLGPKPSDSMGLDSQTMWA